MRPRSISKCSEAGPPAKGEPAGLRVCIAPLDDELFRLCGKPATSARIVEGMSVAMCDEHAREYDEGSQS